MTDGSVLSVSLCDSWTMSYEKSSSITPRIIIHGGAGNITRDNLPEKAYNAYRSALLAILHDANYRLRLPGATALDVSTYAVTLLENNGLFNSGHGAVYTTEGRHELEASVMVSRGYRKRGVGVMGVTRAKSPIMLAREMLIRGQEDDGGGAQGHVQLHGDTCDRLAESWGLETVRPSYFWTRRRWDEHRRGLGLEHDDETYKRKKCKVDEEAGYDYQSTEAHSINSPHVGKSGRFVSAWEIGWDGEEYLPQGTVGAVVMDSTGTICVATSTGGLTNKLPGRIGDTPTLGAGFWAEEWFRNRLMSPPAAPSAGQWLTSCFGQLNEGTSNFGDIPTSIQFNSREVRRACAMSGTGNGDSFLRLAAARTAAAMARFSSETSPSSSRDSSMISLQDAVTRVAGPNGMLQQSAEDRWLKTGEGEGGMIGIELDGGVGKVVFAFNCGGMFHAWLDDHGKAKFQVFKDRVDEC